VRPGKSEGMSINPEALEPDFTLTTAATRLDFLSRRDSGETTLNTVRDDDENGWASFRDTSLDSYEALELLALGEVVSRKAHDSQLIGIRAALRGGASWDQIAEALGVPADFAWESFNDAIAERLDDDAAAAARELAGSRPAR
jgi:hypothetical protein